MVTEVKQTPYWIRVGSGNDCVFEGTQAHWSDCYFSNATISAIRDYLETEFDGIGISEGDWEIREMTQEELAEWPDAANFIQVLVDRYGEF